MAEVVYAGRYRGRQSSHLPDAHRIQCVCMCMHVYTDTCTHTEKSEGKSTTSFRDAGFVCGLADIPDIAEKTRHVAR